MARSVRAEIGARREIKVEFSGFPGESCFDEAERLKEVLKELGLWAIPVTVTPKTSSEIAREIGEEIAEKKKVLHS
ncbi:MAG TPA: hypothetical protein GX529_04590 [Firmicutes bacterium]|nr:hypothetical protein [Candidatus Fermentithermobacillaceae bacterium]